ncbi:MAG TPA: adenylate/guanylate cyclase domain-containing protein [Chloroflexota bacterium]|nr:adenylate/guanylate cyclase domain-containing protein [Chloroflexota bacterium]
MRSRVGDKFAVLHEVGRYINSSLDLGEVLDRVMDMLLRVLGAERGFLMLLDPHTGQLAVQVARNLDPAALNTPQFAPSRGIVQRVFRTGAPELVNDALADPALGQFQSVVAQRLRSVVCAPLRVKDQVIGVVYADSRVHVGLFHRADLELLEAFADHAAIAIENARLYRRLEERLREIADLQVYQDNVLRSVASGVIALDREGRITTLNPAAARILDLSVATARGALYHEVLGPDMTQFLHAYRQHLPAADDPTGLSHEVVCELPRRGRVYLSVRVSPLRGGDGQITGLVVALEDRTEQRALEKRAAAEEARADAYSRFFAPKVRELIKRNPDAVQLGGVRKEISVLFADIRGYTTISEQMAPEEVVGLLNQYLELATAAIRACDGTVDKYIGDAVVALFNAPTDQPQHPEYAVWAAVALQGMMERLRRATGRAVYCGIGVNTGEAVAGNIGTAEILSYTAIGDAVNVAARLQARAGPGEILISEATYQQVHHAFAVERLGPLAVKGRRAPVVAYRVLGPRLEA